MIQPPPCQNIIASSAKLTDMVAERPAGTQAEAEASGTPLDPGRVSA
ncbi:hypothetical protein ACFVFS_14270 [Kitasatospora sp. NPDC057692]